MNKIWFSHLVVGLVFLGCSYHVSYATNPMGAMLVCGGKSMGYTPLTLSYKKGNLKKNPHVQPCEAVWISGAEASFPTDLSESIEKHPKGVEITLQRPEDVEGLEKDMQFALQVQQHKLQEAYLQNQLFMQQMQRIHQSNQQLHNTNRQLQQLNNSLHNSLNRQRDSLDNHLRDMRQQRQHEEHMQQLRRLNNNLEYYRH
ncbi:hypothetical protein [Helicobacter bizzozeronii]|uniref:hypothetical protein n=1 Tax=Helicobacter bizzozeronii TaxID=56877 RepID=UPI000CF12790|nr:hypothetical protein [Helicobacter bizzozeronii]